MQSLGVISINIWQMLISLCNLLLLYWMLRRFFFRPVQKLLRERKETIETEYEAAGEARRLADADAAEYGRKLAAVQKEADGIRASARKEAADESRQILTDAKEKASRLISQADEENRRTREKMMEELKEETIDIALELTGKILQRELTERDHRRLIGQFLTEIGNNHD